MKITLFAIAALATTLAANPVAASTTRHVAVSDLDLTTAQGRAALTQRIERAAWQVCLFDEAGAVRSPDKQASCARDAHQDTAEQVAALKTREQFAHR